MCGKVPHHKLIVTKLIIIIIKKVPHHKLIVTKLIIIIIKKVPHHKLIVTKFIIIIIKNVPHHKLIVTNFANAVVSRYRQKLRGLPLAAALHGVAAKAHTAGIAQVAPLSLTYPNAIHESLRF